MLTDGDKGEIVRAVIRKELARTRFPPTFLSPKLRLSSYGIESLTLEIVAYDLQVTIIDPGELEARLLGTPWKLVEYLAIKNILTQGNRVIVTVSRVKERREYAGPKGWHVCFGSIKRFEQNLAYEAQRVGREWIVETHNQPPVHLNLIPRKEEQPCFGSTHGDRDAKTGPVVNLNLSEECDDSSVRLIY
jgi:hypothetical protein